MQILWFQTKIFEISELRHPVVVDAFDDLQPRYLAYRHPTCGVVACVRLLPTTGGNMLRDCFPMLLDGKPAPEDALIFESSCFCVDTVWLKAVAPQLIPHVTAGLLAAMIEFGLYRGCTSIVTVTYLRVERIVRLSGWVTQRLGTPRPVGSTMAVAVEGRSDEAAPQMVLNKTSDHAIKLFVSAAVATVA